jgi:hypothetical protein
MAMTRSKNATFELHICGQSMILGHTIFFQHGDAMDF